MVRGTCHGSTVINRSLIIEGIPTEHYGKPKLSGDGEVRVLWIKPRATVRLLRLEVLRGDAPIGAGITNHGKLVLQDVRVRRNVTRDHGGGIYNDGGLSLKGATSVAGNRADYGGGIYNGGTLRLTDFSRVSGNRAEVYGGGIHNSPACCASRFAHLTLDDDSVVIGNTADAGGGIFNWGTLVMSGRSTVSGNTARYGGGVENASEGGCCWAVWATMTLRGSSSISGNSSEYGGGIWNEGDVPLDESSSIRDNVASQTGGGVSGGHSIRVLGSSVITGNQAVTCGGICSGPSSPITASCGPGGNVYGNSPDDCFTFTPVGLERSQKQTRLRQ
jgi:hypothetical protein